MFFTLFPGWWQNFGKCETLKNLTSLVEVNHLECVFEGQSQAPGPQFQQPHRGVKKTCIKVCVSHFAIETER